MLAMTGMRRKAGTVYLRRRRATQLPLPMPTPMPPPTIATRACSRPVLAGAFFLETDSFRAAEASGTGGYAPSISTCPPEIAAKTS